MVNQRANYEPFENAQREAILNYYTLLETLTHLKDKTEKLNKFKEMSIKLLKPSLLQRLIIEIIQNFNQFQSYPTVYQLFKHRLEWLEQKIIEYPAFTWKMKIPDSISHHPILVQFYESEQTSIVYTGKLKSIEDARQSCGRFFIYSLPNDGYSHRVNFKGAGARAAVHVVKTKEKFYLINGKIKMINNEIDFIKKHLILFRF